MKPEKTFKQLSKIKVPEGMKTLHDGNLVPIDTPTRMVSGFRFLLSQEEIDERTAGDEAWEKEKPIRNWQAKIAGMDVGMPRYIEDLLDRDGTAGLPKAMADRYKAKKALRVAKPAS